MNKETDKDANKLRELIVEGRRLQKRSPKFGESISLDDEDLLKNELECHKWYTKTKSKLARIFGANSKQLKSFMFHFTEEVSYTNVFGTSGTKRRYFYDNVGKGIAELEVLVENSYARAQKETIGIDAFMHEIEIVNEQTEKARSLLYRLENRLRDFVRSKIGKDNTRIDKSFLKDWESSRKKEKTPPRKPLEFDLICYSTFDQLKKIIVQNENWSQIFQEYFGRPDGIISRLNELDSIRDTIAHNRILSDYDFRSFMMLYEQINGCLQDSTNQGKTEQEQIKKTRMDISPTKERRIIEKVVTFPSGEKETRRVRLLSDTADITQLNIDDKMLDQIYEEAHRKALDIRNDAQFSRFTIQVYPFAEFFGPRVNIYMDFYSKWADKICAFQYTDSDNKLKHSAPDKSPIVDYQRKVFTTLPWKTSPRWMQFLSRAHELIKPLPSDKKTCYHLTARAHPTGRTHWQVTFSDGLSGKDYVYKWEGRELNKNSIKQVL